MKLGNSDTFTARPIKIGGNPCIIPIFRNQTKFPTITDNRETRKLDKPTNTSHPEPQNQPTGANFQNNKRIAGDNENTNSTKTNSGGVLSVASAAALKQPLSI